MKAAKVKGNNVRVRIAMLQVTYIFVRYVHFVQISLQAAFVYSHAHRQISCDHFGS